MTNSQTPYDVIVVGAGPVGLLLACTLKRLGLRIAVVEKKATRSTQSKASSMNAYSLAILHTLGIAPRFLAVGKQICDLVVYWDDHRLMRVDYRRLSSPYSYILGLSQPETEALLEAYYLELGGELFRATELSDFVETDSGIAVSLLPHGQLMCRYLVGCDGGRSTVRTLLGVEFSGIDHGVGFIMFDSRITWGGNLNQVHYFVKEGSFLIVIPQAAGTHRIIMKTRDGETVDEDASDKTERFQALVDKYGPAGIHIGTVIWQSRTLYYNRLAGHYRRGRIFLAGDSCHLFSSIGGLGMNTGFQDAFALAWRLAGVIQQRFSPNVLDSYEKERRSLTLQLITATDINTRLITRLDTDEQGPLRDWLPLMRNRSHIAHGFPNNFSGLGQRYRDGLLLAESGDLTGGLIPHVRFMTPDGFRSSYDLIDSEHFLLLASSPVSPNLAERLLLHDTSVRIIMIDRTEMNRHALRVLRLEDGGTMLIRPDGIVCIQSTGRTEQKIECFLDQIAAEKHALDLPLHHSLFHFTNSSEGSDSDATFSSF